MVPGCGGVWLAEETVWFGVINEGTNGVLGVEVVDCGPFDVVAGPGLGPLDTGGGIV